MSDLLVNLTSQSADASTGTWADVDGMAQASVVVGSASSVVLLIATIPFDHGGTGDEVAAIRFAIDDTREGPEITVFKDGSGDACGGALCWAVTGLSGSHKFALQWQTVVSQHVNTDEGRVRSFQVIEITDASILVNKTSQATDDAVSGFTDIVGLTDTQTVTADSVLLLLGNVQMTLTSSECAHGTRFTIGGAFEGPEITCFNDATNEGCGNSLMWMKDGISGSTAFALQWDETLGAVSADTGHVRSLQVIQITTAVNLLTNQVSQAADVLTGSYTDVVGLTKTASVDSTDSILLFAASIQPVIAGDNTGVFRIYDDTVGEGPEQYIFTDAASNDGCGHSLYWAVTGKSAGSHDFAVRGANVTATMNMAEDRNRSLCILELLSEQAEIEQEGFQFRDDDDDEANAANLGSQDANLSRTKEANTRLRVLLNGTLDPATEQFTLEYKRSGDGDVEYRALPLT